MNKSLLRVWLLSAVLSACTGEQIYPVGIAAADSAYSPLDRIPASFLAQYPPGTQQRRIEDIQTCFDKNNKAFYELYLAALKRDPSIAGDVLLAVALKVDGTVQSVGLLDGNTQSSVFEQAVMKLTFGLDFGRASGEGLYVFWYPLHFRS
jgi:hypothetical protein